jgi:glycosyltransferase involved in cell wall biosynthesis
MACGCFPVAGDIESLREWITPGLNGLLIDPRDPQSLAEAILQALEDSDLRARAENHNTDLIAERAEYTHCMRRAEAFYNQILS